jgi:hypothetical protein
MNNNNNYGKYQLVKMSGGAYMYGLNTATGEVVRVNSSVNNHTFTH